MLWTPAQALVKRLDPTAIVKIWAKVGLCFQDLYDKTPETHL